jgi:hypothetical protein
VGGYKSKQEEEKKNKVNQEGRNKNDDSIWLTLIISSYFFECGITLSLVYRALHHCHPYSSPAKSSRINDTDYANESGDHFLTALSSSLTFIYLFFYLLQFRIEK